MPVIKSVNFSPDGLLAVIEDLERATAELRAVHDVMVKLDIEAKEIPKATQALKGIRAIGTFVKSAQDEMTSHRLGLSNPSSDEKKK